MFEAFAVHLGCLEKGNIDRRVVYATRQRLPAQGPREFWLYPVDHGFAVLVCPAHGVCALNDGAGGVVGTHDKRLR